MTYKKMTRSHPLSPDFIGIVHNLHTPLGEAQKCLGVVEE
jgi:hypothetical protein